mgnify:CR=1 FL=1
MRMALISSKPNRPAVLTVAIVLSMAAVGFFGCEGEGGRGEGDFETGKDAEVATAAMVDWFVEHLGNRSSN